MATAYGIDPNTRYNAVARAFHAVIAVLIIGNLIGGLFHEALEGVFNVMPLHKSFGLTVLFLSLARLAWRFTWTTPPYARPLEGPEKVAAKTMHWTLYALMIAIPLTGWIMSSAGKYPLAWFGAPFPKLDVAKGSPLAEAAHEGHEILGYLAIALVIGHALAALRHHFLLKDGVLRRMW